MKKKESVGSQSKFNIIFDLLEELAFETTLSDAERIEELESQKAEIDAKIAAIASQKSIRFDTARVKEHYMQISEMVRKLKYDFSEIEYNFRALNATAMEKIALANETKGSVLSSIFEIEDSIRESDQGKSFFAFWQLLSDVERSEKLSNLIENLYKIETINSFDSEKKLQNLKFSLLKNGEKVFGVSAKLIEQLRRFLDDRVWLENRRILELTQGIEKLAIEIKEREPKKKNFMQIAGHKVAINSIFSKSLYEIKAPQSFTKELQEQKSSIDMESFYNQFFVDEALLQKNIQEALLQTPQVTLQEVIAAHPITKGVAELVAYISIAKNSKSVLIDESRVQNIVIKDENGGDKSVTTPKIIFVRDR